MPALTRLACALLLALPLAAPAAAAEIAAAPKKCDFRAWSKDRDPAGLNVRAAPRRDATVVGRLPAPRSVDGESYAVEFRVVGGDGPWLMIENGEYADYGSGAKKVFSGRGWVAAGLVATGIQAETVRRAPNDAAEVIDAPKETADGTREWLALGKILACDGRWIEIEGSLRLDANQPGRAVRGWVTDLCGNQVTTCN